jgi:hypothetical protein
MTDELRGQVSPVRPHRSGSDGRPHTIILWREVDHVKLGLDDHLD